MNSFPYWQCGRFQIDLSTPKIMGIVNLTPDSFSDGGRYSTSLQAALAHAQRLCDEGAAILDIGGESTRPGAAAVSPQEEWARVAPVLEALHGWGVPITLDTRRTEIMAKALAAGWVDGINDVAALEDAGALDLLAQYPQTGVCLMHMQGLPETMQQQADYADVVAEVGAYLQQRVQYCVAAGIAAERLLADPGFGFGKNLAHNTALMQQPGRAVLALQADHHRLDGHQLRQGGRQVLQGVRLVDMGECLAHAPMPFVQRPEGHCDQCVVVWFAHAPQSSGCAGPW